jgi:hypothetical protein
MKVSRATISLGDTFYMWLYSYECIFNYWLVTAVCCKLNMLNHHTKVYLV